MSCDHILEVGNVKADNLKQFSQLVLVGWVQVTGVMGYCIAWTKLSDWVQKSDAVIIPIATALVYHVACSSEPVHSNPWCSPKSWMEVAKLIIQHIHKYWALESYKDMQSRWQTIAVICGNNLDLSGK